MTTDNAMGGRDCVVGGEVGLGKVGRAEQVRLHADLAEGIRDLIAGAHDVADLEIRRNLHVDAPQTVLPLSEPRP